MLRKNLKELPPNRPILLDNATGPLTYTLAQTCSPYFRIPVVGRMTTRLKNTRAGFIILMRKGAANVRLIAERRYGELLKELARVIPQ
ncbi:MAG TPA: hypothetical protein VHJ19_11370 [Gammaproteobacteria bacterium]|nr:hypothetical protein [Gammaproteobacteria bacterium]